MATPAPTAPAPAETPAAEVTEASQKADTTAEARAKLCERCHVEEARYKCPACAIRTCSAACVKEHKTAVCARITLCMHSTATPD